MRDPAIGKTKRVTGTFIFMIGAGMILDLQALRAGGLLLIAGSVTFAWGLLQPRTEEPIPTAVGVQLEHTESHS